jgi:hypothetical protein
MPEQMIEDFVLKEEEQEKRKNKNEKAALRRLWRAPLVNFVVEHRDLRKRKAEFTKADKHAVVHFIPLLELDYSLIKNYNYYYIM